MRITTLLLASSLVLAACGSKQSPAADQTEPSAQGPAPAATERVVRQFDSWRDTMPEGATALVGFNVTRLARSPLVNKLTQMATSEAGDDLARLRQMAADCQIDFPGDFTTAVFAAYDGDSTQIVGMIWGEFDQAKIADCIGRAAQKEGEAMKTDEIEGYQVYRGADDDSDAMVSVPKPGLILLASNRTLMEAALRGTDASQSAATELSRLAFAQPQDEAVWFAVVIDPQHQMANAIRDQGGVPLNTPLRAVFGHVAVAEGLAMDGGLVLGSAEDAGKLLDFASQQIAGLSPLFEAQGLGGALNTLQLAQKGEQLTIEMAMTAEEVDLVMRQMR